MKRYATILMAAVFVFCAAAASAEGLPLKAVTVDQQGSGYGKCEHIGSGVYECVFEGVCVEDYDLQKSHCYNKTFVVSFVPED